MEDAFKRLGQRIRKISIARGFASQEALAEHLNMHRTFIGHRETGRKNFRLSTIIRVADALNVELADLFKESTRGVPKPKAGESVSRSARLREIAALEKAVERLKKLA